MLEEVENLAQVLAELRNCAGLLVELEERLHDRGAGLGAAIRFEPAAFVLLHLGATALLRHHIVGVVRRRSGCNHEAAAQLHELCRQQVEGCQLCAALKRQANAAPAAASPAKFSGTTSLRRSNTWPIKMTSLRAATPAESSV